jgi:outer membrane receptor for ferrienterochelin and colicins
MRRLRFTLAAVVLASLGVLARERPVRADDTGLEAALSEPIVATASDSPEDESTAPATTTTITAEDMHRYGIKSLDEAINFLSLGMVTQTASQVAEIGSRGVLLTGDFGNHVLLLVNGHAMNEQWDGTAYFDRGTGIPFELIDHIEVILGPGSVLYGSNAMLGVINVVTKRASDWSGVHFVGESDLLTNWRAAVGFGHEFKLLGKPAEVTYELEYFQKSGPVFTFGPQNYGNDAVTGTPKCFTRDCATPGVWGGTPAANASYANLPDGYLRVLWGDFELDAHAESFKRATPYAFGAYNDTDQYELERWLSADLKHRWAISSIAKLRSRLYGDTYDYHQRLPSYAAEDCLPGQNNGCRYDLVGVSRWVGLEEQLSFDWLHNGRLTTLLGVDGRLRFVGSKSDSIDINTRDNPGSIGAYQANEYLIALYAQQTWRPVDWLAFNVGARFDDDQRFGNKLSPRAAVAVTPWDGGTLKVVYSEAFRAPTLFETSYTDNSTHIPAPNLRPETVRSYEASIEHRFGSQRVLFGAFYSKWIDMTLVDTAPPAALQAAITSGILPPGTMSATQYQNISGIDDYGFNAGFDGSGVGKSLRYALNVTAARSRRTTSGGAQEGLTVTPQLFGNARVSYDLPGDLPVLGVAASLVGRRPTDAGFGNWPVTPYAPAQLDLRGTISGPVPGVAGLSYRLIADYAFASRNPYVIGPVQAPVPGDRTPELVPVDQFRTTVGMQYDLR